MTRRFQVLIYRKDGQTVWYDVQVNYLHDLYDTARQVAGEDFEDMNGAIEVPMDWALATVPNDHTTLVNLPLSGQSNV